MLLQAIQHGLDLRPLLVSPGGDGRIVSFLEERIANGGSANTGLFQPTPVSVVEIGVYQGTLSRFLLDSVGTVQLLGVDPYMIQKNASTWRESNQEVEARYREARAVYDEYRDRSELKVMTSAEASRLVADHSFDLVFIDGDHTYEGALEDIDLWLPKVKPGGILAGHDFFLPFEGVIRAVYERAPPDGIVHTCGGTIDVMWWWVV